MEIRLIKTEQDYNEAIQRIESLWGSKKNSVEGDELDLLCTLVEARLML
jgi:HTH-type transcriptional regulator/antitoxin HigA